MAAIAAAIRTKRGPGRPAPAVITCLSLSWWSGCSGGRPFLLPPPLLKGMILFFRCLGCRRHGRYRARTDRVPGGSIPYIRMLGATSPYGIVAGKRIALALIKGTNLRGIVSLIVHFERRAREHVRRQLFDCVPDRFGSPGKAPIPLSRTAFCREQLGGCRVIKGGHEANIDLFRKRRPH